MKAPNLDRKIAAWIKRNPLVAGEVRHVSVAHDDWCRFLRGKGDCNCNPEFSYAPHAWHTGDILGIHVVPAPSASSN